MADPVLAIRDLAKAFGRTRALRGVDLDLQRGEIHAIVGENGAGKSTLIRILAGDHAPDAGTLRLDGQAVRFAHPGDAIAGGVGFVHQIPAFVLDLSIAENWLLGLPYDQRRAGLIHWPAVHRDCRAALAELGLIVDPRLPIRRLTAHQRQMVAVARAIRRRPKILVLDEVTAALSEPEVALLLDQVRRLKQRGVAIIYVSHRLEEIFRVADRVTVLRDGLRVATLPVAGLSRAEVARHIVGSDIGDLFRRDPVAPMADGGIVRLAVKGLGDGRLTDIGFQVAAGEIVGLAGLGASGRSRLLRILGGAAPCTTGQILLDDMPCRPRSTRDALGLGIALVTEDRNADGFVESLPIWQNVTLPWAHRFSRFGVLHLERERQAAAEAAARLGVRMPSLDASMTALSGGNQQKAIFARWITGPVRLLLLDEPTHGVDIGSKAQIYDIIRGLAGQGLGVLVASSELEELAALCHRVLLLRRGTIDLELTGEAISKDRILHELLAAQ